MNTILVLSLAICATLAVASAYPAPEPAEDAPVVALEEVPELTETEDEALQPEESRWGHGGHHHGHGGWGHGHGYGRGHGWGHHGHGWGHHGHGWGRRR